MRLILELSSAGIFEKHGAAVASVVVVRRKQARSRLGRIRKEGEDVPGMVQESTGRKARQAQLSTWRKSEGNGGESG